MLFPLGPGTQSPGWGGLDIPALSLAFPGPLARHLKTTEEVGNLAPRLQRPSALSLIVLGGMAPWII